MRVATYNFGRGRSALADLAERADVIVCQEAGDRRRDLRRFLAEHPTWTSWSGDGRRGRGKTPILWNTKTVVVTAKGSPRLTARRRAPKQPIGNKYGTWVEANGVRVLNVHAPHALRYPVRRRMHGRMMHRAAELVRSWSGPVVVAGDLNARHGHRNLEPLRRLLRLDNPPGVTHRKTGRRIDLVMARGVKATGAELVTTSSDHRTVVVTYAARRPC